MTNELQTMKSELMVAQQQAEIMNLRLELQKLQAEKSSRLEDSLFAPALFEHYQKVAEILSKSNVIPKDYKGKPEDIFVAIAMGYQLGFPVEQALQDIAVINGRPCIWGDGLLALALSHPDCESITEEPIYEGGLITGYICTVKRKGHVPHSKSFTLKQAKQANLLGKPGPWTQYTDRMLQMRARVAIKDKFADKLRGLKVVEIDEYDEAIPVNGEVINNNGMTQTERLKNLLNVSNVEPTPSYTTIAVNGEGTSGAYPREETKEEEILASPAQISEIEKLMDEKEFDDKRRNDLLKHYKIASIYELSPSEAEECIIFLKQARKT